MKDLVSLPARTSEGVLVVVETPVEAAHGDDPRDVFAFPERLRREQKDLRFLGWGGIDEHLPRLTGPERTF
jgi:hypothetical protein